MKRTLDYYFKEICNKPLHMAIAVTAIVYGIFLISDDHFFKWPPFLTPLLNDDIIGGLFVLAGISIIAGVLFEHNPKFDALTLAFVNFLFAMLVILELGSDIVLKNNNKPWIANAAICLIIMIIARRGE